MKSKPGDQVAELALALAGVNSEVPFDLVKVIGEGKTLL